MNKALIESFFTHAFILIFVVSIISFNKKKNVNTFSFDIVEKNAVDLKKNQKIVINSRPSKLVVAESAKKSREIFGIKRKAITAADGKIVAKVGNTLTKKNDDKELRDDELDSLPEPAEEFLITAMPRAINEIRPEYPKWAKEQKITGSVIFEILIDQNGDVRQAKVVRSLHPTLDELAKNAIMKFKFKPAFIEKKPSAVRIKYAIKYLLES